MFKLTTLCNIATKSKLTDPTPGVHNATIVSVLATSGCTAGSLLAACGAGVDIANVSALRNRTERVSQPAAIATCNMGNNRIEQVTEATITQNRNYRAEGTCGRRHWNQQGGLLLEIQNT
jgi:hypothetical protein